MKKVIIAGASGLIGGHLLQMTLDYPGIAEVITLARSPLKINHPKLRQIVLNFDDLDKYKDQLEGDAIYCCLGTTKSKTADEKLYRKIDHDYPVKLSELASANKVKQFHFISALGANANSTLFYNRLKGETEIDIQKDHFQSIHIYRPSLLIGKREENRPFEKAGILLMTILNPLLIGPFKQYKTIKAQSVAKAMLNQTIKEPEGVFIYPSDKIKELV